MKQAIIDIGSNSMRLTVYEVEGENFRILFKEKIMAGLAGYVEEGVLSADGIERACAGLLEFKETTGLLGIENVAVFATASLRNIVNTDEAVADIREATDYLVEVITGEEEAKYGCTGAMRELQLEYGSFIDVGGASTEVAVFSKEGPRSAVSFSIGSLSLYRTCVKRIMPGESSLKKIREEITRQIDKKRLFRFGKQSPMACVGGTSRAVLKFARQLYSLPPDCHTVTAAQLHEICARLCRGDKAASDLILKLEPDRIHTMVPGVMILDHIASLFETDKMIVSKYGVREGYLCQKILCKTRDDTHIPKTEN